jgi:hypothetical protein
MMGNRFGYPDNVAELQARLRKCELAMTDLIDFPPKKQGFYVRAADYLATFKPKGEQPDERNDETEQPTHLPEIGSPLFGKWLLAAVKAYRDHVGRGTQ